MAPKWEVHNNFIDDFLNGIDVVALKANSSMKVLKKIAVVINNKNKYLSYSLDEDHEPKLKMTEQMKLLILKEYYQWEVINVDEDKIDTLKESIKHVLDA